MDINALKSALSDSALTSLSDDAVQSIAGFGTPILTPKTSQVTYKTLAAVWGTSAAATFYAGIQQAKAATNAFAAVAGYVDARLGGPGIDPSNPEVATIGKMFVDAQLATQDQLVGVFFDASFKAGTATTTEDIKAARAALANDAAADALQRWLNSAASQANAAISAGRVSGSLPTQAQLQSFFNPGK